MADGLKMAMSEFIGRLLVNKAPRVTIRDLQYQVCADIVPEQK